MSQISTILPPEFIRDLNESQHTIEVDPADLPPEEEPTPEPDPTEQIRSDYEEMDQGEPSDQKPYWMDATEGMGEQLDSMPEEEIENLAQAFADFCQLGKDILEAVYEEAFIKACKQTFGPNKKYQLIVLQFADLHFALSYDGISKSLEAAQQKDDRFKSLDYIDLLDMGLQFRRLKRKYSTRPLLDYQKEGIERYSKQALQKYLQFRPDPLLLLGIYLFLSFGMDLWRLGRIQFQEWKTQKRDKQANSAA